jgi:hypothetical protein
MKKSLLKAYEMLGLFKNNWKGNYRYHGGWMSAIKCFWGMLESLDRPIHPNSFRDQLDILTFSIVPSLTLVWLAVVRKIHLQLRVKIFIGDCSGGIRTKNKDFLGDVNILPLQNEAHGQKLDYFFARVCQAEYVLVCDDDIFFLDASPLEWGLLQMQADPNLAVVSFVPRERFTWEINQQEYIPMGSYCLLIRREIWLKEELSFRTVHRPSINPKSYQGEYDTADFANVELIRRGYRILITPPDLRSHIHISKGVSGTLWEVQSYSDGDFQEHFSHPLDITYANLSFVKEISVLAERIYPAAAQNSFEWESLIRLFKQYLSKKLSQEIVNLLDDKVNCEIQNLSSAIFGNNNS